MKHGRKEQFSVTINQEVATEFYKYMDDNNILYKNLAFEQLIQKGLINGEYIEKHDQLDFLMFKFAYGLAMDTALQHSKSKMLKRQIKLHYETLEDIFLNAKQQFDI